MRNCIRMLLIAGLLTAIGLIQIASAEVIIKVRALNPLETREKAVINYPLPKEITEENILKQKITYSLDHSEDEEPPKDNFQISFDEKSNGYFIDDEVFLLPKEVVTLEVHVEDVWSIEKSEIDDLKSEVNGLLQVWEEELRESGSEEEKSKKEETKEFAIMMKEDILEGLEQIIKRQESNTILKVGVEKHIAAYEENIDELRQVEQDIELLANLFEFEAQEEGEEIIEEDESSELEVAESEDEENPDISDVIESDENSEL